MGHLADGHRGIAMLPEQTGETGMLEVVGPDEEGPVVRRTIGAGKQSVAGSSAGGGLHEMTMEGATQRGQLVDIGRLNIVDPEALQLGAQVVDAEEQDVGMLLFSMKRE
jgi:hypothetical protein